MGNTAQDELTKVWKAIKNNDFGVAWRERICCGGKGQKLGHAATGYSRMTPNAGIGDILGAGFCGTLEPQKSGCIKVFTRVPSDWEQYRHPVYAVLCPERDPQLCTEPHQ